jgi:hypothetical protein
VHVQTAVGLLGSQSLAFGGIQDSTQVPLLQFPLQHWLAVCWVQVPPFAMHIGVVVEVEVVGVVVDVEVEVVGVVVEVEVVGVVVEVLVEVVLVVLLVDVLVEVVLVEVVVVPHGPRVSPWPRWPSTALWGTSMVFSAGVPGLWQMVTFCCWARAREGISAAKAVPAKSLRALRLLSDPSARARARSSKEWATFVGLSEGERPPLWSSVAIRTLSSLRAEHCCPAAAAVRQPGYLPALGGP